MDKPCNMTVLEGCKKLKRKPGASASDFLASFGLIFGYGFQPVADMKFLADVLHKITHGGDLNIHFIGDLFIDKPGTQEA